jgi:hypothetical protein
MRSLVLCSVTLLAAACTPRDEASPRHPEQVVDSVIPREEALRRFREGLPEVPRFEGGAPSRDALLRAVAAGIAAHDTAALQALTVSRAEFAWLYYPTARQGLPPYDLAPALYWFTIDSRNHRALGHLLEGSTPGLRFVSADCGTAATTEGANQVWGPCTFSLAPAAGGAVKVRYLSLVVEREGTWKVLQYSDGAVAGGQ